MIYRDASLSQDSSPFYNVHASSSKVFEGVDVLDEWEDHILYDQDLMKHVDDDESEFAKLFWGN